MRSQPTVLILNDAAKLAVKKWRDAKPWQRTEQEITKKLTEVHRELCRAYDLETILVRDDSNPNGFSGRSAFNARKNKIELHGRLSVVTYLLCFGCAIGGSPRESLRFAVRIFRHYFPRSAARCEEVHGMMIRRDWYAN